MSSVNKVILIGNLGQDPETRSFQDGGEVANLRIATSEEWKDRQTGERKERTEWHSVAVFGDGLVNICKQYLRKGSKVYLEGQLQTRTYEKDGVQQYRTEVVLRGFNATLKMMDGANRDGGEAGGGNTPRGQNSDRTADNNNNTAHNNMVDDGFEDIPF